MVLSCSSSSQLQGTCDSQACCCCGDIGMGFKRNFFFATTVESVRSSETNSYNWWTYWFSPNSSYIHQDFFVAQRHKNQIQALQVERGEKTCSTLNFDRLFNSLSGKFYVNLVFLVCYLPLFICLAAIKINGPNISLKELLLFSISILNLNSSLKPVIYCWRMRRIRRAIMDILQNLAWNRNHASQ